MHYPYLRILLVLVVIAAVIGIIVKIVKKAKGGAAAAIPAFDRGTDTPATTSDSDSTSTIFINGGAPASGNIMGKISVDGNSLTVRYTDAPLEIIIPAGRHHVVVEGGVAGDARIDRFMDFGILDVWTVDLPGGNDADVIRHQMIGYSEYKQALRDSNFHVTKREL